MPVLINKSWHILLLFTGLITTSCENGDASNYFNRPKINECVTLIQDGATLGMMACDGKITPIPARMVLPKSQKDYSRARKYYGDRELGHYICRRYKNKCPKKTYQKKKNR